jgi:ribosomal protein S11
MLKQNKNSNFKENNSVNKRYQNKKFVKFSLTKKHKNLLRIRKTFRFRCHVSNPSFRQISNKNIFAKFSKRIFVRVGPNNIFCTLVDEKRKETLYTTSSGKCGINTSKKTLRYSGKIVIQSFFDNIKKYSKEDHFLITIIGPKKTKKLILEVISNNLKGKNLIIDVKSKKCFNGCRPPKKRRKKQKGFRIFK